MLPQARARDARKNSNSWGGGAHETTLASDRIRPQTTEAGTAAHLGLVIRRERMLWDPWGSIGHL